MTVLLRTTEELEHQPQPSCLVLVRGRVDLARKVGESEQAGQPRPAVA
jgi:hypothetical protein